MVDRDIARDDGEVRGHRPAQADFPEGPTGRAQTTESRGDPEADDLGAAATEGAAAGGLVGLALGGPLGAGVGAAIGGAAGAAGEAGDTDLDRGFAVTEDPGPGAVDPALDPTIDEQAAKRLAEREDGR